MRAILINATDHHVGEVLFNGDYKEIYQLIGCDTFTVVQLDDVNAVYVDDEGLLNDPRYFFCLKGYAQPLAGNGLILGTDDEGESIGTTLTVEAVKEMVSFREYEVKGFRDLTDAEKEKIAADSAIDVGPDNVIGHVPVFADPRCPACGGEMRPKRARNALSRYCKQYICPPCGVREAVEGDFWENRR